MRLLSIIVSAILFWGCPSPIPTTNSGDPVEEIQFAYLQESNQLYFGVVVNPEFFDSVLDSIQIRWYGTDSTRNPDVITLNDQGEFGDILPGDDRYARKVTNSSGSLTNTITLTDTGKVFFKTDLLFRAGTDSRSRSEWLGNLRPVIINVTAPDTATRPASGIELVLITCQVHDANGLDDIRWVGFKSYHDSLQTYLNGGNYIYLYDDGSQQILYEPNITSGDSIAFDGIYSFQVPLSSTSTGGSYHWIFEAQDLAGSVSDTVVKQVIIQ